MTPAPLRSHNDCETPGEYVSTTFEMLDTSVVPMF